MLFRSERLVEVERRLAAIYDVARKHKVNPEALPVLTREILSELDAVRNVDEVIDQLAQQLSLAESDYTKVAKELSTARKAAANVLQADITRQLQALGMHGAAFEIGIDETRSGRYGIDDVEFLIATIPGSEAKSLARIASGGELSRISLAIQVITAKTSSIPSLVFEIGRAHV